MHILPSVRAGGVPQLRRQSGRPPGPARGARRPLSTVWRKTLSGAGLTSCAAWASCPHARHECFSSLVPPETEPGHPLCVAGPRHPVSVDHAAAGPVARPGWDFHLCHRVGSGASKFSLGTAALCPLQAQATQNGPLGRQRFAACLGQTAGCCAPIKADGRGLTDGQSIQMMQKCNGLRPNIPQGPPRLFESCIGLDCMHH